VNLSGLPICTTGYLFGAALAPRRHEVAVPAE